MLSFGDLSERANAALNNAVILAMRQGCTYVGSEHLLAALCDEPGGGCARVFVSKGISRSAVLACIEEMTGRGSPTLLTVKNLSPHGTSILKRAAEADRSPVTADRLLLSLCVETGCTAHHVLQRLNLPPAVLSAALCPNGSPQMREEPRHARAREHTPDKNLTLLRYGTDLSRAAREGRLTCAVAREKELSALVRTLCRRSKNNPCLLGEPGVGKTAVVEQLALDIEMGLVPDCLLSKTVFSLDLGALIGGTKYRGDFEERLRRITDEVRNDGHILLFIDELHTLVGAGAAEGAIDAANLLKPALANGSMQVIGATTFDEYRRCIQKDAALERRFQPITVEEPSQETAVQMLEGKRAVYERFHGLTILPQAVDAAVRLSARYLNERFLPDKAFDLLDEAASEKRVCHPDGPLTADDVARTAAAMTGIPIGRLDADEEQNLRTLEQQLAACVIGQEQAVRAVAAAVRRNRSGIAEAGRPAGSFLFVGPTGVGKTALCYALCEALTGSRRSLIRFDMSEYTQPHSVAGLIGAPPGYVGFENGGRLTERVRRNPYCVVLFDEIEKAHPDLNHLLLQILEDGTLTDSRGVAVSFKNAVIILTSNLGAAQQDTAIGFSCADEAERIQKSVRRHFRPELLGRLDDIAVFTRPDTAAMTAICRKMLDDLARRMLAAGVELQYDDRTVEALVRTGWDRESGARSLRAAIRRRIEDPAAELMVSGFRSGRLYARGENGEITLKTAQTVTSSTNMA
ncbi:MAG: ATP-dependent Clp protease ATP-binding subunit [Clostridia bacterium]|nr:ATP-dependent Clp protease ATP-binding subunit [Clostridia bacterium]